MIHEKPYRSIIKALSWRTVGTVDTVVVSFFITGKITFALSIGFVELFTKTLLYFLHERTWNRIPLGKVRVTEPEYTI